MPPPSALKRKILLKNKRLKPDVEKMELELFLKGELQVERRAMWMYKTKFDVIFFIYQEGRDLLLSHFRLKITSRMRKC